MNSSKTPRTKHPNDKDVTAKKPKANLKPNRTVHPNAGVAEVDMAARPRLHGLERTKNVAPPARRADPITRVEAKIDVGFGNALFIRGEGNGLTWDRGVALQCVDPSTWVWVTDKAHSKIRFKLLLNDETWVGGEDLTVEAGSQIGVVPAFS